ncbi:MAG: MBL fold metallo-hydrolase [Erysipelotrichaceae bacterium]|nr:MBL fold metallo-hydrolase [Erysipelotrichaceae bacterium]
MKITFFGTTTLLFDDGKDQILFDAHLTRPSLMKYIFGSEASNTSLIDEKLKLHHVDRLKAIFVSHSHHDHVMDAPYIANRCAATIYGSSSALNVARGGNVPEERLIEFKANETYTIGEYKIKIIPSIHSKPTILNNDLGQTIDTPLVQPARLRDYKEGGSYDFYVETEEKTYMIRPSFNYIKGQMDGYQADVLFLGVAGLQKADEETERIFFEETVGKLKPSVVIPLHWDNFFSPLDRPVIGMPRLVEKTEVVFFKLARYCEKHGIDMLVQMPLTSITI